MGREGERELREHLGEELWGLWEPTGGFQKEQRDQFPRSGSPGSSVCLRWRLVPGEFTGECAWDQLVEGKGEGSETRFRRSCLPCREIEDEPPELSQSCGGRWPLASRFHSSMAALGQGWGGLLMGGGAGGHPPALRPSSAPKGCPWAALPRACQ